MVMYGLDWFGNMWFVYVCLCFIWRRLICIMLWGVESL